MQIEDKTYSPRPATLDDLAGVLEIERKSYPLPWTEEAFRQEMEKPFSQFLVLTDDETDSRVIGYAIYWTLFDECHVLNIAVDPDYRGLGVAKALMRQSITEALHKDLKRVFLEVRKSNAGAIALYQKLGFFIDHVKKAFYEDGEDAYFMVLYLNQANRF